MNIAKSSNKKKKKHLIFTSLNYS
jgi:hypothetical protein